MAGHPRDPRRLARARQRNDPGCTPLWLLSSPLQRLEPFNDLRIRILDASGHVRLRPDNLAGGWEGKQNAVEKPILPAPLIGQFPEYLWGKTARHRHQGVI